MTGYSSFDAGPITIFLPLVWAILAVWVVLWIALPFGVFGVKKRLDRIIGLLEDQWQGAPRSERSGEPSGTPGSGTFESLRRELTRLRQDISVQRLAAGRADLWLTSSLRRIRIAEIRQREGGVELELNLNRLSASAASLRPESVLARIDEQLSGQSGIRVFSDRKGYSLVVRIDSEGEAAIPILASVLQSEILNILPA